MAILPTEQVIAASNAWIWVPPDEPKIETEEYLLVAFPDYLSPAAQVLRTTSDRPAEELIEAVLAEARGLDRAEVRWWIKLSSTPADLEQRLIGRGATLDVTVDVFAADLTEGAPDLGVPDGIEIRVVEDEQTWRDAAAIEAEAFEQGLPPEDEVEEGVRHAIEGLAAGTEARLVAYRGAEPAGTGGVSLADDVVRLWNGGVRPQARGRGVYRALLGTRLQWGRDHGGAIALVKGRIETSGPILRRAGFSAYGTERAYLLPTSPQLG